jgi:hypothetical protein
MSLAMTIPEGYREPLLLKCVRGLSYRAISELLGLPETTIETRIARGRRMLRDMAGGRGSPGGEGGRVREAGGHAGDGPTRDHPGSHPCVEGAQGLPLPRKGFYGTA